MEKIQVSNGIFWVEIPEADLRILCGCPADSVKHLMNKGLIVTEEKNGISCETGPNAILLSEVFLQNGHFANLAEFPVLQMLYRQGLILPNHPNNTGRKPMLLGRQESLDAQLKYIYRGNYGLISKEELMDAGLSETDAEEQMRFKLKFAFDNIRSSEDLLDSQVVCEREDEVINGVTIRRVSFNVYEFKYKGEKLCVDLNLSKGAEYTPPYHLDSYQIKKEYFSIIHSGEGDGWDKHRPCMGSLLTFQGKIYLIDAGPNLVQSLRALGIGITEIEGLFHTHAHDDHFAGLTALLTSDHKVKYYAAPTVRASAVKKFSALMAMHENQFSNYFEPHDLTLDTWNNIDGLEVRPSTSPHPVETTTLFFRTLWGDGYKSYAHLADVASFRVLEGMIQEDKSKSGVTKEYYEKIKREYLEPATIKKVDIGGGMIHGESIDFRSDQSEKILLSHTSQPLSAAQREIGSNASFGAADVMIPATQDYTRQKAFHHFKGYFPSAPQYDLQMLLNSPTIKFNPGTIVIRKGDRSDFVYLVLSGILEFISSDFNVQNKLTVGSFMGELTGLEDRPVTGTYRAISHAMALKIPRELYLEFLKRNSIYDDAVANIGKRSFLQMTWLFGDKVSCPLKNSIVRTMELVSVEKGWSPANADPDHLFIVEGGELEIGVENCMVETLRYGDFFGEENVLGKSMEFTVLASQDCQLWKIPKSAFLDIPIIHWKLSETFERRLKKVFEQDCM